jgi:hypothetical protein
MAALPRKWVSGGAPTLPWQTIALPRAPYLFFRGFPSSQEIL